MKVTDVLAATKSDRTTFGVRVRGVGELTFRYPGSADEYNALRIAAIRWVKAVTTRPAPHWQPYLPLSEDTLGQCFWVRALGVDPKWSETDVLMATHDAPALIPLLYAHVMQRIGETVMMMEADEIEGLGETSEPTDTAETS